MKTWLKGGLYGGVIGVLVLSLIFFFSMISKTFEYKIWNPFFDDIFNSILYLFGIKGVMIFLLILLILIFIIGAIIGLIIQKVKKK